MGTVKHYGMKVLVGGVILMVVAFVLRQSFVPDNVKSLFRY